MEKYLHVGTMRNGEAIYIQFGTDPLIEKDHTYLTTPTPEEREELIAKFPHLKP